MVWKMQEINAGMDQEEIEAP